VNKLKPAILHYRYLLILGVICSYLWLPCLTCDAHADMLTTSQPEDPGKIKIYDSTWDFKQAYFCYHYFQGAEMREAYGNAIDELLITYGLNQSKDGTVGHFGFKVEAGIIIANGKALPRSEEWKIEKADLSLSAFPFNMSALYRLTKIDSSTFAVPYVSLGIGIIPGFEKLSVKVSKEVVQDNSYHFSEANWEHTNIRSSFTTHAALGLQLFASRKLRLLIEFKYILSGKSGYDRGELPAVMKFIGFTDDILDVVVRPDFNFTGPMLAIGLEW